MLSLMICPKSGSPSPLTHGCKFAQMSLHSAEQRARAGSWGGMEGCMVTPPKPRVSPHPSYLGSATTRQGQGGTKDPVPSPEPNQPRSQASAPSLGTSTRGTLPASSFPRGHVPLQRGPPQVPSIQQGNYPMKTLKAQQRGNGCSHHPETPAKPFLPLKTYQCFPVPRASSRPGTHDREKRAAAARQRQSNDIYWGGRWGQLAADFFFLIHLPLNKIVPINKALTQNRFQRGKKQTQDARQPHTQKRLKKKESKFIRVSLSSKLIQARLEWRPWGIIYDFI